MTQKEQKNQIKNLLACAERLLCCMTEVQQDMDEAAKSIKQQNYFQMKSRQNLRIN